MILTFFRWLKSVFLLVYCLASFSKLGLCQSPSTVCDTLTMDRYLVQNHFKKKSMPLPIVLSRHKTDFFFSTVVSNAVVLLIWNHEISWTLHVWNIGIHAAIINNPITFHLVVHAASTVRFCLSLLVQTTLHPGGDTSRSLDFCFAKVPPSKLSQAHF